MGGRAGLLGTAVLLLAGTVPGVAEQAPPKVAEGGTDVVLTTSDGMKLAATHWRAHVPSGAGVVLLHMYRRDRTSWNPLVEPLRDRGLDVLAIDLRGHGGSAKQGEVDLAPRVGDRDPLLFVEMHRDAWAGVRWLVTEARCDPKRIGIAGASVGCSVALDTVKRHSSDVAAVVCMSPGTNYLGLPSLEHAKEFPSRCALLLITHAQEAKAAEELGGIVKHARVLVYDEKRPSDAALGWGHGTRMFGPIRFAEQTVASFLSARLGSLTDDVVLDGFVEAEAKPGGPWTRATPIPIVADGCSAWAYRVGRRLVVGGTAPRGLRAAHWKSWTEVEVPADDPSRGEGTRLTFPLSFVIDLESGVATSWISRGLRGVADDAFVRAPGGASRSTYTPPRVRVIRSASGVEYEGEFVLPISRADDEAPLSDPLVTVELAKEIPLPPVSFEFQRGGRGEGVPIGSR